MDHNEINRKQSEKIYNLLASHDTILCVLAVWAVSTLSVTFVAFFLFMLCYMYYSAKKLCKRSDRINLDGVEYPANTILLPKTSDDTITSTFRKNDEFTALSLPFINVILCPVSLPKNGLNRKRYAQLIHEFGHCNRYDVTLIFLSIFCLIKFLYLPAQLYFAIPGYYEKNAPVYPLFMFLLSILSIVLIYIVFHRREYIADFYAMNRDAKGYEHFLWYKAENSASMKAQNWIALISKFLMHPSWRNRFAVQRGENLLRYAHILLYSTYWSFFGFMLVTSMLLPRLSPVFLGGEETPIIFLAYLAIIPISLFLYKMGCFMEEMRNVKKVGCYWSLVLGYASGLVLSVVLIFLAEEIFFEGRNYNSWFYLLPFLVFIPWLLSNHLMLIMHDWFNTPNRLGGFVAIVLFIVCYFSGNIVILSLEREAHIFQNLKATISYIAILSVVTTIFSIVINMLVVGIGVLLQRIIWGKKMRQIS